MTDHDYRWWLALVWIMLLVIGGLAAAELGYQHSRSACQEDEPCWDWRTMGNRSAGFHIDDIEPCPGQEPGDVIVVNMNDGIPCKRAAY